MISTADIWENWLGDEAVVERFRRSISRNRMSHAYLFHGPKGVGKKTFAVRLAQCLFCERIEDAELQACGECPSCKRIEAKTHPDFLHVECPKGKRILPVELFIGSKERRGREGMCHEIALKPMSGNRKIAIVDDTESMNPESANALLKTLEEPPEYATLILIASNADSLLPTIRSRCQQVRFSPLNEESLTKLLQQLELTETQEQASEVAMISEGSLETARKLLSPELRGIKHELDEQLGQKVLPVVDLSKRILKQLDEISNDATSLRQNASWTIRFCRNYYASILRSLGRRSAGENLPFETPGFLQHIDEKTSQYETVLELLDRCIAMESQLSWNISVPLSLESFFSELARIVRNAEIH